MAINLSTAGIHLYYAKEVTAGQIPTAQSSWTDLVGVKSTPDFNPAPDTLETTTLNETEWKTYIDGLKDPGGALEFNFNMTQELVTLWENMCDDSDTQKLSGLSLVFLIDIPGLTQGFYFTGNPSRMGLPPAEVSSVLEITNRITPTGAPVRAAKPQ